ncbi:MAG: hypothetical protein H6739_04090 [Alphaproteobacteria bacterium]|nr:hypothetical protein [Alphaproteobacteria bacterium]
MDLWNRHGPIRDPRILFLDRPEPFDGLLSEDGVVHGEQREWRLSEAELYERWLEGDREQRRFRCLLVDDETRMVIGAMYWLVTRRPTPQR